MKWLGKKQPCWCKSGKSYGTCHGNFDSILREYKKRGFMVPKRKIIKNQQQLEGIRESGKRNIAILDKVAEKICIGMSTEEINQIVHETTLALGGIPAPLGYEGFPKSVCTSINHEVCHGIPSKDVILKEGDIVNVDVSTLYNGYYSDSSRTFLMGEVSQEKKDLVRVAKECIDEGLKQVKPWKCMGDMGYAIFDYATKHGYTVVEDIGGHGIGLEFHEDPYVSYVTQANTEMVMVPGMVFTIEPMINMGTFEVYVDEENGWTVYTEDHMPSAQWEVMVAVTEEGYEIMAY